LPAILTRLTKLSDTSLIVHWFTADHGLIKTVAKGAFRPKSAFSGKLDLFFSGEIDFIKARRGELHTLKEVSISHWREGLRKQYSSTLLAAYCCQLLEAAVEPEHPDDSLHDLLTRALDHIDTAGASLRALKHFESELSKLLGVFHHQHSAEFSLRETLGHLPATRRELIERLAPPDHLR
jgi:DNA repair protein RecO (recombination protein O)